MKIITSAGRTKTSPGLPIGSIVAFYGSVLPDGWALCDGTLGTPDLRDRFIVGDVTVGLGSAVGTDSLASGLTHAGAAIDNHSNHVVTQPSAHSDHIVTQPSGHSAHAVTQNSAHGTHTTDGAHTHDSHALSIRTFVGVNSEFTTPTTHSSDGGHTHASHSVHSGATVDAHSAHSGMTVDAHSAHTDTAVDAHSAHVVGQPSTHSTFKHYLLAFIKKVEA